ncbi:uncharacterized protein LOC144872546 [Branchiostoma floridae x Branchiostoma japonicum]
MDLDEFCRAVEEGYVQTVRRGLEAGVDINARRDSWTSLHVASQYGQTEVAELLIKNGADLEARDIFDQTSLHVASLSGQTEVAELLIKNGADLEARDRVSSYNHTLLSTDLYLDNGAHGTPVITLSKLLVTSIY